MKKINEKSLRRSCNCHDFMLAIKENGGDISKIPNKLINFCSRVDEEMYAKAVDIINNTLVLKDAYCHLMIINSSNEVQVFSLLDLGTNGLENSIKGSMIEIINLLNKLELHENVIWANVCNTCIDAVDDLYSYVVTFTIKF